MKTGPHNPKVVMGPVLGLRGVDDKVWNMSAIVVTEAGSPILEWKLAHEDKSRQSKSSALKEFNGRTLWRFEFDVPVRDDLTPVLYSIASLQHSFEVPAKSAFPKIAYCSCNGFSDLKLMKQVKDKNERWKDLLNSHKKNPFSLLLMGGDQVYADSMWTDPRAHLVQEWVEKSRGERVASPFTKEMRTQVEEFYFRLYCERWSQSEMQMAFASIPSVMMWDDHDIFDGWGSYEPDLQNCPVYQGIFTIAREMFALFQLQSDPTFLSPKLFDRTGKNFTFGHRLANTAILVLDLRSERTGVQVMSPDAWKRALEWMDNQKGCRHLLLVSSIPVVYPSLKIVEDVLGIIPGEQELEDDLNDHWTSPSHLAERARMVHRLLRFSRENKTRVTILSGDVHVAAHGVIESGRHAGDPDNSNVINQLISSGIVHPPPPGIAMFLLEKILGAKEDELDRGIVARTLQYIGRSRRFIANRNWLSLVTDDRNRIWADWHIEGMKEVLTKVIHPIDSGNASKPQREEV